MRSPRCSNDQRHAPALGEDAQHVLERVDGADRPAAEADDLVAVAQAAAKGVGLFQNVVDDDAAAFVAADAGAQRGMVDDPAALQMPQESS